MGSNSQRTHGAQLRIDIGGGTDCAFGFHNLDPVHGLGDWKRMAQDTPWPVASGSMIEVRASHVMEHIPAGDERIAVMNEAWRVLQPGGTMTLIVPLIGYTDGYQQAHQCGWQAHADPTHVSGWWFPESLYYFYTNNPLPPNAEYGIKMWNLGPIAASEEAVRDLLNDTTNTPSFWGVRGGWEGVARLEKPGP